MRDKERGKVTMERYNTFQFKSSTCSHILNRARNFLLNLLIILAMHGLAGYYHLVPTKNMFETDRKMHSRYHKLYIYSQYSHIRNIAIFVCMNAYISKTI